MDFFCFSLFYFVACDAKQAYATGRGIQPQGVRVRDLADFKVHTEDAGEGVVEATVTGPSKFLGFRNAF